MKTETPAVEGAGNHVAHTTLPDRPGDLPVCHATRGAFVFFPFEITLNAGSFRGDAGPASRVTDVNGRRGDGLLTPACASVVGGVEAPWP